MPNIAAFGDGDEHARQERIMDAAALVLAGLKDPDTAAAVAGVTAEMLFAFLDTEEGQRAAIAHGDRLDSRGELLKARALPLLHKLLRLADERVDSGEVSASAVPKLVDSVVKVAGLAQEHAARLRVEAEDDSPKATIFTLYADDPEPPPAKPNEHRLIIRLPTARRPAPVIDVTPTDEGDNDGE